LPVSFALYKKNGSSVKKKIQGWFDLEKILKLEFNEEKNLELEFSEEKNSRLV
jgi:hypothetical protein